MARGQRQFRSAFGAGSVAVVVVVVVVLGFDEVDDVDELEGMLLSLLGVVVEDMLPLLFASAGGLSVAGCVAFGVLVSTGLVD
jgi:hypothetical protein